VRQVGRLDFAASARWHRVRRVAGLRPTLGPRAPRPLGTHQACRGHRGVVIEHSRGLWHVRDLRRPGVSLGGYGRPVWAVMARHALLLGGWEWVATPEGGPFVSTGGRLGAPPFLPQSERVMLALEGLLHQTYEAAAEAADQHMRGAEAVQWWYVVGVRPAPDQRQTVQTARSGSG
jgi:hypothetical protein